MSKENKEKQFEGWYDIWIRAQLAAGLAREFTDEENRQHAENIHLGKGPKHPTSRWLAGKSELDTAKIILD